MLTVAQERLNAVAAQSGKKVSIHLFGQEINPETYAIAKADMMLKGDGEEALHIAFGSTLSSDQHATRTFDFMLANPPYQRRLVRSAAKVAGISDIREMYIDDSDRLNSRPTKEE